MKAFFTRSRVGYLFVSLALSLSLLFSPFSSIANAATDYSDLPDPASSLDYTICGSTFTLFGEEIPYGESDFVDSDWAGYSSYEEMFTAMYAAFTLGDYLVTHGVGGEGFTIIWSDDAFEGFSYSSDADTSFLGVDSSTGHLINLNDCSGGTYHFNSAVTGNPWTFAYGSPTFSVQPISWRFANTMSLPPGTYDGPVYDPSWNSPTDPTEPYKLDALFTLSSEGALYASGLPDTDTCLPVINPITSEHVCLDPIVQNEVYRYTLYDDSDVQLDQQTGSPNAAQYQYTLRSFGTYHLKIELVGVQNPTPFIPWQLDSDATIIPVTLNITHNGLNYTGNTFDGTTSDCSVVDDVNDCTLNPPLKDCSTFFEWGSDAIPDWDLAGGIACNWDNTFIQIKTWFFSAFVPDAAHLRTWSDTLGSFFQSKLGLIYQGVSLIITLFQQVYVAGSSGACTINVDGTFFGATLSIDICTIQEIAPDIFATMQVLIVGITIVSLYFAALRKYHEVLDQR